MDINGLSYILVQRKLFVYWSTQKKKIEINTLLNNEKGLLFKKDRLKNSTTQLPIISELSTIHSP